MSSIATESKLRWSPEKKSCAWAHISRSTKRPATGQTLVWERNEEPITSWQRGEARSVGIPAFLVFVDRKSTK